MADASPAPARRMSIGGAAVPISAAPPPQRLAAWRREAGDRAGARSTRARQPQEQARRAPPHLAADREALPPRDARATLPLPQHARPRSLPRWQAHREAGLP